MKEQLWNRYQQLVRTCGEWDTNTHEAWKAWYFYKA